MVLFFCDRNLHCFTALRSFLSPITVSAQHVINWPVDLVQIFFGNFVSKHRLLEENTRFRSELLLVRAMLQRLSYLEQENSQLRSLLHLAQQPKTRFLAAQLLTLITDGLSQQVTIDKGKIDGLYVGQSVVDAYGLFGQVTLVGARISRVLLVTDIKSAIPVIVVRNGMQAIVVGTGRNDNLELVNIPETADIRVGDFLVTSKLGQRFPAGYAVGVVKAIKHIIGERFIKVLVIPSARVNSDQNVLLIIGRH